MSDWALTERLVALAFATDAVLGGGKVVDAYFGDHEVEVPDLGSPELLRELQLLAEAAEATHARNDSRATTSDLAATARALASLVQASDGSFAGSYEEALEAILGRRLTRRSNAELDDVRAQLIMALDAAGYAGGWPDALRRWQEDSSVTADDYVAALEERAASLRPLAREHVLDPVLGATDAESVAEVASVEFELVDTEATWAAYHVYEGGFASRVEVNRRRIFNRDEAVVFASHEVYPGHHTHSTIREHLYRRGLAGLDGAVSLLHTPQSVIDEGIGEYAWRFMPLALDHRERAAFLHDRLITDTRHGIALDLNAGRLEVERAITMLSSGAAISDERARRALEFASEWRYYFPAYTLGYDLVAGVHAAHGRAGLPALYRSSNALSVDTALTAAG